MTKLISEVDFKEWEIYALKESDYLSTYIFNHVDNNSFKYNKYMIITFSEFEFIKSSWRDYDLWEMKWHLEMDSLINDWFHIYNLAENQWDEMYWETYGYWPAYYGEELEDNTSKVISINQKFNKENRLGIYSLDTEKKEYSLNWTIIKLKPCEDDLKHFNYYLKEFLTKENEDE
jgi:hypothetical protein